MWRVLNTRHLVFERILAFSIPIDGQFIVVSSESVHLVDLNALQQIRHDYRYPRGKERYNEEPQIIEYMDKKFTLIGGELGDKNSPILQSKEHEQLVLDHAQQTFKIIQENGEMVFEHHFDDISGDWCQITFSTDDRFVLLGLPYELFLFERIS